MTQVQTLKPIADEQPFARLSNQHAKEVLSRTDILWSPPGASRRAKLLAYLRENASGLAVNRRHQIRDSDPDIHCLLKKGHVHRVRVHSAHGRSGQTYIRVAALAA